MRMFCIWFMMMIRGFFRVCSFLDCLNRCWGIYILGDFKIRVRICMVLDVKFFFIVKFFFDFLVFILFVFLFENIFFYDFEYFNRFYNGLLDRNFCCFYLC